MEGRGATIRAFLVKTLVLLPTRTILSSVIKRQRHWVRCLWGLWGLFGCCGERTVAQIDCDPVAKKRGWNYPVAFPKAQRPIANYQMLSRL